MKKEDIAQAMLIQQGNFIDAWNEKNFLYDLNQNTFATVLVIEDNQKIIGFIDYWIMFEQATINNFFIKKDRQRQGLGSQIINEVLDNLIKKGVHQVSLEVRVSNIIAKKFYEKFDFKQILIKPAYYYDGEDACFMVKVL